MADIFNYEGVKACMGTLDSKFSEFAEILKKANDYVNENIHVSHDSALYGDLGKKMLDSWNENASTFSDFYENFTSWSQLMASIMASYGNFENQTVQQALGNHQTTGAKMKGVQETRDAIKFNTDLADVKEKVGKGYTVLEQGVQEKVDLGNGQTRYTYIDGTSVTYITNANGEVTRTIVEKTDGTIESNYKLEDGGSLVEKYDKNGKAVSSDIVDPKGTVVMTREYSDRYEAEKVIYYNSDGSVKREVKVHDDIFGSNMKDFKTSDMLVYSNALAGGTDKSKISSSELVDIQGASAFDNNIERYQKYHDYMFFPGMPTPYNPTGIPGMGGNHFHTFDDARFVNPDKLASGQEQSYVSQRVQERGEVAATEAIDIQSFKNEQGYSSVGGDNTPSGYSGGNSGYNPGGNQGGGQPQVTPQPQTGGGGVQRVPYTGTNGGNPQPLPANGGQPQVVPVNNNGNSGYSPNTGNTTPEPSGPVYYV